MKLMSSFRKIIKNNLGLKITSIVLAILLWIVVAAQQDRITVKQFSNVPVSVLNEDILSEEGLTLLKYPSDTVSIRLEGKNQILQGIKNNELKAWVDLSSITRTGLIKIPVLVDNLPIGASIEEAVTLEVTVDEIVTRNIPVRLDIGGEPPEGYILWDFSIEPEEGIEVTGPMSELLNIVTARAKVDIEDKSSPLHISLEIQLIDESSKVVESDYIKVGESFSTAQINIYPIKEVTIDVSQSIIGEPADGYRVMGVVVIPSIIEVCGVASLLDDLYTLPIEIINIDNITDDLFKEVKLNLPDEVYIIKDQSESVQVLVQLDKLVEKTFSFVTSDIEIRNAPVNMDYAFTDSFVNITVRVPETLAADLNPGEISMWADASTIEAAGVAELQINADIQTQAELVYIEQPVFNVDFTLKDEAVTTE